MFLRYLSQTSLSLSSFGGRGLSKNERIESRFRVNEIATQSHSHCLRLSLGAQSQTLTLTDTVTVTVTLTDWQ